MCGIAGFSGDFDGPLLDKMQTVIAHRGPDDSGILFISEKRIGLAHRRLSIIDLSSLGHQPMWDQTKTAVIVFNGEIYNYRELKNILLREGYGFISESDTEVLLNLYLCHGEKMLSYINGIFAFAIWDIRNNTLFLARDGMGVKPLYYAETPKGFIFSSELKAILKEPSIDRTITPKVIQHHLSYLWSPAPDTMLKAVKKLRPGYAMTVKDGFIQKKWQFYDLPYSNNEVSVSVEEAVTQLQKKLREAVERQMVADVPVGAFLGGLDSSAVVTIAKEFINNGKLQCFTIAFKDDSYYKETGSGDLPYARKVAKHLGVDLHTVYVDSTMIEQLERMIYHLDEPQADLAPL
jgi:asparagine synthase (glutamine-hydrolysing)